MLTRARQPAATQSQVMNLTTRITTAQNEELRVSCGRGGREVAAVVGSAFIAVAPAAGAALGPAPDLACTVPQGQAGARRRAPPRSACLTPPRPPSAEAAAHLDRLDALIHLAQVGLDLAQLGLHVVKLLLVVCPQLLDLLLGLPESLLYCVHNLQGRGWVGWGAHAGGGAWHAERPRGAGAGPAAGGGRGGNGEQ